MVRGPRALWPTGLTALRALVAARWLCWLWMLAIMVFANGQRHPPLGWACVAAAGAFTVWSTGLVRHAPERMIGTPFVAGEALLALGLSALDGLVFEPGHVWGTTQSLATQWPLLAAATVGVALGPRWGAAFGLAVGPAEWAGALLNEVPEYGVPEVVSLAGTSVMYAGIGAVVGWWSLLLRRAEHEIADRRARDEVARVIHDTVLQTLALVERRSTTHDPDLAAAARDADRDLRAYLFGASTPGRGSFDSRVRVEVERVRAGSPTPVVINVVEDGLRLGTHQQDLMARAIGAAVANALEHAAASRVVVFVEAADDGSAFASVSDDGVGFDPVAPRSAESHGIAESIKGRIESIGGRVEIRSAPGKGTEVLLWSFA